MKYIVTITTDRDDFDMQKFIESAIEGMKEYDDRADSVLEIKVTTQE